MSWCSCHPVGDTAEVHVHPLADTTEHELTADCVCVPTAEPVVRGDGSVGWLMTHHSLDGREQHEPDYSGVR